MRLRFAHQILIASAIGLAAIFGLRALVLFARGEGAPNLVLGLVSLAIGAALGLYLRAVRAKWSQGK